MSRLALTLALAAVPALAGCSNDSDQAVDAVSPSEAKALDDAAQMLDQRRLPPDALDGDGKTQAQSPEREAKQ
jgi:hypothetical protein